MVEEEEGKGERTEKGIECGSMQCRCSVVAKSIMVMVLAFFERVSDLK
jgi:hypothetical protein